MIPVPVAVIGDTVVLAVPDEFSKNYLEQRLEPMLMAHLTAMFGADIKKFSLFVDKTIENQPAPAAPNPAPPAFQPAPPVHHPQHAQQGQHGTPQAHWTLQPTAGPAPEPHPRPQPTYRGEAPAYSPEVPRTAFGGIPLPSARASEPPVPESDPIAATIALSTGSPGARSSSADDSGARAQQAKLNEKYVF